MSDIVEQAAEVLKEHPDMTDRSANDGCECGYPDPRTVELHQAQALADAGLLAQPARTVPTRDEIAAFMKQHFDDGSDGWLDMADVVLRLISDGIRTLMADHHIINEIKAAAWDEGHDAGYHACHWEHLTGGPCADDPNDSEATNPHRAKKHQEDE